MPTSRAAWQDRISAWLRRWRPLLPVFAVQMIVTIGFGALLPVLPLYIQEFGIDPSGLGVIVASWAVAKLLFEPIFGWWADRALLESRLKYERLRGPLQRAHGNQ